MVNNYNFDTIPIEHIHQTYWSKDFFISNDGKKLVYLLFHKNKTCSLQIADIDKRHSLKIAAFQDSKLSGVWIGREFIFSNNGIYSYNYITGKITIILKCRNVYPVALLEENQLLYISEVGTDFTINIISCKNGVNKKLCSIKGTVGDPQGYIRYKGIPFKNSITIIDNRYLALIKVDNNRTNGSILVFCLENDEATLYFEKPFQNLFCFFPILCEGNASSLFFSDTPDNYAGIYRLSIQGISITPVVKKNFDIRFFITDSSKKILSYEYIVPGTCSTEICLFDIETKKETFCSFSQGIHFPLAVFPEKQKIYYYYSNSVKIPDCWQLDLADNTKTRITTSLPWNFIEKRLCHCEELIVKNDPIVTVKLYKTNNTEYYKNEKYPLVLYLRGGPTVFGLNEYIPFESWLANLGYVVCSVNYRGTLGYGKDFINSVKGNGIGVNDIDDVKSALDYCKTIEYIDKNRIGVVGLSYGGYLTLKLLACEQDIKAGFVFAAITDWYTQQNETNAKEYDYWLLNSLVEKNSEYNIKHSPLYEIEKIRTPVMITHGCLDNDVPFSQIELYLKKAKGITKKIKYCFYKEEGHGLPAFKNENYYNWHNLLKDYLSNYINKNTVGVEV